MGNICVVSEGHDVRHRKINWQKGFWPAHSIRMRPCLFDLASQTMYENNTELSISLEKIYEFSRGALLNNCIGWHRKGCNPKSIWSSNIQ
jgi:hypothetical protein